MVLSMETAAHVPTWNENNFVCVCVSCGCWNWGKFVKFWRKFQEIIDKFGRIASKIDKISENIQKFSSFPIIQKTSKNSIIFSKENYCQSTYSFTQFFAEISVGLKECIMSIADGTSMPEIVQKYPPWEKKMLKPKQNPIKLVNNSVVAYPWQFFTCR